MMTYRLLVVLITLSGFGICAGKDTCFECHLVMEGMSLKFTNDVHFTKEISCVHCHGGDPNESNQNISMSASRGFKVRVTRQGVPEFCGSCHSDTNFMSRYKPTLRTDQLEQYKASIHGKQLAAGRRRAAECVDCHSVHDIRAVTDPLSKASPRSISRTCARCHESTAKAFADTEHGDLFTTQRRPGCTACHSAHHTEPATSAMLTGPTSVCAPCHKPDSEPARVAEEMGRFMAGLEAAGPASKEALARAKVAVHSVDLAILKKAAESSSESPKSDEK
jgi:predicted CXXCH cytochrome family protein